MKHFDDVYTVGVIALLIPQLRSTEVLVVTRPCAASADASLGLHYRWTMNDQVKTDAYFTTLSLYQENTLFAGIDYSMRRNVQPRSAYRLHDGSIYVNK